MIDNHVIAHICGQDGNHFYTSLRDLCIHKYGKKISLADNEVDDGVANFMLTLIKVPLNLETGEDHCMIMPRILVAQELFRYVVTGDYDIYLVHRCFQELRSCCKLSQLQKKLS